MTEEEYAQHRYANRDRQLRADRSPRRRLLGSADPALDREFPVRPARADAAGDRPRAGLRQAGGGAGERAHRRPRCRSSPKSIQQAAGEVARGDLDSQFPLVIWQTGSGTQSNMNANEVIAGRANEILTGKRGGKSPVHPNDHVNKSQSSNDSFPTAMHIAAARAVHMQLLPALAKMHARLADQARRWDSIVKIGRTHLQDATPLTLGQEFSGYAAQVEDCIERVEGVLPRAAAARAGRHRGRHRPQCARPASPRSSPKEVCAAHQAPFTSAPNKFAELAAHDTMVELSGVLNVIAVVADQDRQRHPAARLGPALRPRRTEAARRTSRAARSCRARSTRPRPRC